MIFIFDSNKFLIKKMENLRTRRCATPEEQNEFGADRREPTRSPKGKACWRRAWPKASPSHSNAAGSRAQDAVPDKAHENYPRRARADSTEDPPPQSSRRKPAETAEATRARRSASSSAAPSTLQSPSCSPQRATAVGLSP